jgi:hypothetical protein
MNREYKYMISSRQMKTKLSTNYYYTVQILCKEEFDSRFRIVYTKSFNKQDPDALEKATYNLSQMSKQYK